MSFGEKLQQLRKEKGLSQEDLAHQLNISRQAVSKWESQNGYPEIEKMILISDFFQVSLDYLMKEDYEEHENETISSFHLMTQQNIKDYLHFKKSFALGISCSVLLMIIGLFIAVLCADTSYQSIGVFGFLIMVGIGVFFIIMTTLLKESKFKIEREEIKVAFNDLQNLQEHYQHFHKYFTLAIAGGVLLIIVSLACIALLHETYSQYENILGAQFLLCIGIAVFLFIYFGILKDAYQFLIHNKAYIKAKKKEQQIENIYAFTMPLAAVLYMIMGFTQNWWHPGWVIFPLAVFVSMGIEYFWHR